MSQFLERYNDLLLEFGVHAPNYRSSKLKNRLRKAFGDNLSFRQPAYKIQSELVFNSNLEKGEIVETVSSLHLRLTKRVHH